MKKFNRVLKNVVLTASSIVLLCVAYGGGCKVGLGETVDTEPPKVYIENPKIKAIVSSDIEANGTWEDDKGVSRIEITVTNNDTNTVIIPGTDGQVAKAELSGKNWSYTLLTTASENAEARAAETQSPILMDGTYKLSVMAYDNVGHASAQMERIFEVDNNPPVFVLSRPASLEGNANPSAYGRKIEIKGVISDDHFDDVMNVHVFREDGSEIELAKSTFNKFDNSDTYVTIAQYYTESELAKFSKDSDERKLHENYKLIYGDKDSSVFGTTQKYYAIVSVKDSGNNESKLAYIRTPLNKLISEAVNAQKGGDNVELIEDLKAFEFRDILKDSYDGILSSEQQQIVKSILNGTYDQAEACEKGEISETYDYLVQGSYENSDQSTEQNSRKLSFTVNSKANPTYQVLGFEIKGEGNEETFGKTSKDGTINIRVNSGLDGSEIEPCTITARIIRLETDPTSEGKIDPRNSEGRVINENGEDVTDEYVLCIDGSQIYDITENPIEGNKTAFSEPTTFSINLAEFKDMQDSENKWQLTGGKYYIVEVLGEDIKENELIPANDKRFGFQVELSQSAAKSVFENNNTYKNAKEFAKDGTVEIKVSDDDEESNISIYATTLIFKDEIRNSLALDDFEKPQEEVGYDDKFEDVIPNLTGAKSYIESIDTGFGEYFDTLYDEETKTYLGDNFTIAILVNLAKQEGNPANDIYYIYADNKAPEISISNAELEIKDSNNNIIITDKQLLKTDDKDAAGELIYKYSINGLWSDVNGSGTNEVRYLFLENPAADYVPTKPTEETKDSEGNVTLNGGWRIINPVGAPKTTSEMKLSNDFPLEHGEGKNKAIFFYATDKVGNETPIYEYRNIIFDLSAPSINSSAVPNYFKNDKAANKPEIILTANDTNELRGINVVIQKYSETEKKYQTIDAAKYEENGITLSDFDFATTSEGKNLKTGTRKLTLTTDGTCDGKYKIETYSTDIANRQTEQALVIETTIDGTKPEFKNDLAIGSDSWNSSSYFNKQTLKITGSYNENGTGMDTLYYYLLEPGMDASKVPADLSSKDQNGKRVCTDEVSFRSGENSFNFTLENLPDNTEDGSCVLYIQAKDTAGNLSEIKNFALNVDNTAPTLEVSAFNDYYKKGSTAQITFTAEDKIKIGDSIEITVKKDKKEIAATALNSNGITITEPVLSQNGKLSSTLSFDTTGLADGSYTITALAKDKAGNSSNIVTVNTIVDTKAPVFKGNLKVGNSELNSGWYSNVNPKISGSYIEELSGMDTLFYVYT